MPAQSVRCANNAVLLVVGELFAPQPDGLTRQTQRPGHVVRTVKNLLRVCLGHGVFSLSYLLKYVKIFYLKNAAGEARRA